jgi:hypothetical protein
MPTQITTTFALIRTRYAGVSTQRGVIEELIPTVATDRRFERSRARNKALREWADGKSSIQFRKFEWMRSGPAVEPNVLLPDVILRIEQATLTVAYPVLPGLYGTDDLDSMEDVIRADARQIRDVLLDPGNLVDGCAAVLPTINDPDRDDSIWFQTFTCELTYYEGQTLFA